MTSVDSLRKRIASMKARSNRDWVPRTWSFVLEVGEELPPDVQAKIDAEMRPNDLVYVRYIATGFLGTAEKEGNWSWGYVHWHGGAAIIRQDGILEKVRKH